jgi:hypothetical protein
MQSRSPRCILGPNEHITSAAGNRMTAPALPGGDTYWIATLCKLGRTLRDAVIDARHRNAAFAGVSRSSAADTIYELDAHVEPVLEAFCENIAKTYPLVLIAEGIVNDDGDEGAKIFPQGSRADDAVVRLIVDPIDGTRGLMYDKRSAWVIAGVAPNRGAATRLSDIAVAMQAEVPTSKQTRCDVLWASATGPAEAVRDDLIIGTSSPLALRPSQADTLAHGFASISNFFPGTKEIASRLMEKIAADVIGHISSKTAATFDDQYISTGGQLYELMVGHDRFTADLRPLFYKIQGVSEGLCVHPYDIAAALIARRAGVIVTDGCGSDLDGPLDTETSLSYAAFANPILQQKIEPVIADFWCAHGIVI